MKVLLSADRLQEGVDRLAGEIRENYAGEPLTIIGVLTGSLVLLADLIRRLDMPLRLGLVQASSYRGRATSPGSLVIRSDMLPNVEGRHLLVVDDIFDTGRTLLEVVAQLDELQPASIRTAVLLRKRGRTEVAIEPHFVAFEIPDQFVVGYGLDYNDLYRNLPYVAALEPGDLGGEEPRA